MNEVSMKYTAENTQLLLGLIADTAGVQINKKGIDTYEVRNLAGTVMLSNDKVVVYVDETDRRYAIFETGEKYRNNQAWFADFETYVEA